MAEDRTDAWRSVRGLGKVAVLDGIYLLTSDDVADQALKAPDVFSSRLAFESLGSPLPLIPIAVDPPDHTRYRKILQPFFSPRALKPITPDLTMHIAETVDRIATAGGECDFMAELAVPFPAQVFLTLFGLPLDDLDRLLAWKDSILTVVDLGGAPPEGPELQHSIELFEYLSGYIATRRGARGDDLLSGLLRGPDALSDEEAVGLAFLFVLAGLDTVTSSLGFTFYHLARDPHLRGRVNRDPACIDAVVEEMLRYEVPVPSVPRVTTRDVEIGGTLIPAGSHVNIMVGAVNRDGTRYTDPDVIDIDRGPISHMAFGGGPHRCLGSHLARLELRIALEQWHLRIPDYQLAAEVLPRVTWPAGTLRLEHLPLDVSRAAGA